MRPGPGRWPRAGWSGSTPPPGWSGAARAEAADGGLAGLTFEVADLFALPFADGSFDVVHAHQVLQHVADPVAALVEMRRVCRPGGLVAARDGDYPAFTYVARRADLDRAIAAYGELTRVNRAHWDAGATAARLGPRRRVHRGRAVGLGVVLRHRRRTRAWWGGLWADRFTRSALADQLLAHGLADRADLEAFAAGLAAVGGVARRLVRRPPRRDPGHRLSGSDRRSPAGPTGRLRPGRPAASTKRSGASTIG